MRIATGEQERLQTQLFHLMGQHTGHSWEELETFFLRDKYLNAQEALEFGLIDEVMGDSSQLLKVESRTHLVHFTKK